MTAADTTNTASTDVGAIAKLVTAADEAVPVAMEARDTGQVFMVHRNDFVVKDITLQNAAAVIKPKTVVQHVKLDTVDSFIDYVNRFKNFDTVLFADIKTNSVHAIIDYHKAPLANVGNLNQTDGISVVLDQPDPQHRSHLATLTLPFSQEWGTWTGSDQRLMSHKGFASFLEENAIDIRVPAGADLLELCRDLQMVNNVSFTSAVRHGNYNKVSFQKENDATSKGEIGLPNEFIIAIPVYFEEIDVEITAFLRKEIDDDDGLKLGYKLSRIENIRQNEFHRIVDAIANSVDVTTLYGKPA